MPTVLPFDRLLTRRPDLAVFISALRVHPHGFEFDVDVLRRPSDARRFDVVGDSPFARHLSHVHPRFMLPDEGTVRFGVRYADGRSAWADSAPALSFDLTDRPDPPVIRQSGGRGAPGQWRQRYWVWGLPRSGDIEFVYSWPAADVSETTFAFDGDAVRAAAANAVVLWDEPGDEAGGGGGHVADSGR